MAALRLDGERQAFVYSCIWSMAQALDKHEVHPPNEIDIDPAGVAAKWKRGRRTLVLTWNFAATCWAVHDGGWGMPCESLELAIEELVKRLGV